MSNVLETTSTAMQNDMKHFLETLVEAGALDEESTKLLEGGAISTGIGMLTALARLNLVNPLDSFERSTGATWTPSLITLKSASQYRVDDYVVSENNRLLVDLLRYKIATESREKGELFYIRSEPGMGKSHLLMTLEKSAKGSVRLFNVMDLELEIERAVKRRARSEFYAWLLSSDVLILDDLQHSKENSELQKELRRLILSQIDRGGIIIVAGQGRMSDMDIYDPGLWSILISGTNLTLALPDKPARHKILRRLYNENLPEDAINYLVENANESVRQLLGAATQLVNLSWQTGTTITKDMARAVLPLPCDLRHSTSLPPSAITMVTETGDTLEKEGSDRAEFFREILSTAENEEEQALALQIAIGQRLRELKDHERNDESVAKMEEALSLLREGQLEAAIKRIG